MADSFAKALSKDIHKTAKELIRKRVIDFATELVIESKLASFRKDAELVLSSDVDQAYENILRTPPQSRSIQLMIIIGSALFGAFVPGFVGQLTTVSPNPVLVGIYTILGFVGILLVFMGLRKS